MLGVVLAGLLLSYPAERHHRRHHHSDRGPKSPNLEKRSGESFTLEPISGQNVETVPAQTLEKRFWHALEDDAAEALAKMAVDVYGDGLPDTTPWKNPVSGEYYHREAVLMIKVLFAISAFPFVGFMVPFLRTLFTHTSATGYTRRGQCVPIDTCGLSNYLGWIHHVLRPRGAVRAQLAAADARTLARFDEEVRDAERLLALIGPTPRAGGQMRMRKKRDELDRMLQGMVDRIAAADGDAPNHPLRHACAPDQILLRQFEDALGDQGRLRSWRLRREYNRRHRKTRDLMSVVLGRARGSTRAPSRGGGIGRLTRAAAGGARRGINALAESFSGRREGRAARTASSGELEA